MVPGSLHTLELAASRRPGIRPNKPISIAVQNEALIGGAASGAYGQRFGFLLDGGDGVAETELRMIYELLFRDGVLVAKKDKRPQSKHPEIKGVTNLQVMRAMGSLKSRGYVRETFAWRHFYWYLTNAGIVYLRDYLRLPLEIVPSSLQRIRRPASTLDVTRRVTQMQVLEGMTSYAPKSVGRGHGKNQELVMDRQAYRHRRMEAAGEELQAESTLKAR
ncbi:hypothetical protein Z043_102513, partial [Scleropages formosus]